MHTILHLSSEYPPQPVFGLGRYVQELAEAQAALGHRVEVITNSIQGKEHETVRNGVRVKRVHYPPPPQAPATSAMLLHFNLQLVERCMEAYRNGVKPPNLVLNIHDWLTAPAGVHLARLLGCPLVATIHDVVFNKVRGRQFNAEDAFIAGIENWTCQISARLIVLSESIKQEIIHSYHAPPDRIEAVPGGVGIKPILASEAASVQEFRRRYCSDEHDLILYVGRLDPEKGVFLLLDALRSLRASDANGFKVLLAGSGRQEEAVRNAVTQNGLTDLIAFAGYLNKPELRLAYAGADILVVPSEYEPFGLVSLESQRIGTPAIVAHTGGLVETLSKTGGGCSFAAGNAPALADAIRHLLENRNLRHLLGNKGREGVERHYQWRKVAIRLQNVYQSLVGHPAPALIEPVAWTPPSHNIPDPPKANIATMPPSTTEPMSDIAVFWDTAQMKELDTILERLHEAHALRALGGSIHVLPVVYQDRDGKPWAERAPSARVIYHRLDSPEIVKNILSRAAVLVAQAGLKQPLLAGIETGAHGLPIVWCDQKTGWTEDGLHVSDLDRLYCAVTKALCDERFRAALAVTPSLSIPQVTWSTSNRKRPKIMHVLPQLVTGGAETTLLDLLRGTLGDYQHEILSLGPLEGPLPGEIRALGVEIHRCEHGSASDVLGTIRTSAPDLLHLHSMSYVERWIPIHRALARAKIVETEHVVNIGSGHFGPVDKVICVSAATQSAHDGFLDIFEKGDPRFETVYNGIDHTAFSNLPSAKAAKEALGLPLGRPIIGRVSALARNKLPEEALQVIPLALKLVPDALFVIVGDGPQRKSAEDWVAANKLSEHVRFLGERRDIPQVLRAFDVFAYYTTKDALGNVILEAIAAGVPVVTTDVEGTSEALGKAPGALVPLGDLKGFADAVAKVLREPPAHPPFDLPAHFRRESMARRYMEVYKELLAQPAPAPRIKAQNQSKLLIKFPTRGRPKKFLSTLDRYTSLLSGRYPVEFLVSCDDDDTAMARQDVVSKLKSVPNLRLSFGPNKNKVQAINADMEKAGEFSVLLLASDDMIPQVQGYDAVILEQMERSFPSTDGVLFFNDGFRGRNLNTLVVMGKKYFDRFGYVYHPAYECLWCDNEFTDVANLLGRQVYLDQIVIRHEHPLNVGGAMDEMNKRDEARFQKDKATYLERRETRFGVSPRVVLSILIATLKKRVLPFERLRRKLAKQISGLGLEPNIEILSDRDEGERSIGSKRNALMQQARGEYVCYVDDDDDVTDDYVEQIYAGCADGSRDCVGIGGLMIGPQGTTPKPFVHSIRFKEWFEKDRVYCRPPNHLNPIRREIALRYPFRDVSKEEDKDYSMGMARDGVLKNEFMIDSPIYRYFPSIFREEPKGSKPAAPPPIRPLKTGRKVLFVLMARLGDVLCGIPSFKQLRKECPGDYLAWAVMPQYRSLVPSCADEVITVGKETDSVHTLAMPPWAKDWDRVIDAQPSWHLEVWKKEKLPLVRFVARLAGVKPETRKIELELTDAHHSKAEELTQALGDFVVVNAGPHVSGPNWPVHERAELAQRLRKQGLNVAALAGADGVPLEGAQSLFGLDFHTAAAVVERARLYIGQDCGTSWLACAAHETPKIVLIDRTSGRIGYDSYVDCLDDVNIAELPLGAANAERILEKAAELWCPK